MAVTYWVVVDLESDKSWVYWNEQTARRRYNTQKNKYMDYDDDSHVYIHRLQTESPTYFIED